MSRRQTKAVKVTLRFRMLNTGKETLYLDFYPPIEHPETGKPTRREYLGMQVQPLKKRNGEYQTNKDGSYKYSLNDEETINVATIIRNNRQNKLDKSNIYSEAEKEILKAKERSKGDFIQYFANLANERETSNHDNWISALAHLKSYLYKTDSVSSIRFCDITLEWSEGFKRYLLSVAGKNNGMQLKNNTAAAYFIKFKIALKTAFKYGYLPTNINADLKSIKELETTREFLTLDELRLLVDTPCTNPIIKKAALFSALTGLRHSDIRKMKWDEIVDNNGEYTLKYTIKKTNKYQELPISVEAVELCGERNNPNALVFDGLNYTQYGNKALAQWLGAAGITRNVTFHCFRHTYATLQLSLKTDITTIQKMLGHKKLETTMVYAKTLEAAKREAANKITLKI